MPRKKARPLDRCVGRGPGDLDVGDRRAGADPVAGLDRHAAEAASQAHHDTGHAAATHDEIRTEADGRDRDLHRNAAQGIGQIRLVGRHEHHLGRTPDPEPGEGRRVAIRRQPPAQVGQSLLQRSEKITHLASPAASSPGKA